MLFPVSDVVIAKVGAGVESWPYGVGGACQEKWPSLALSDHLLSVTFLERKERWFVVRNCISPCKSARYTLSSYSSSPLGDYKGRRSYSVCWVYSEDSLLMKTSGNWRTFKSLVYSLHPLSKRNLRILDLTFRLKGGYWICKCTFWSTRYLSFLSLHLRVCQNNSPSAVTQYFSTMGN